MSIFEIAKLGLLNAGIVKAPPVNASSNQIPFWKSNGTSPKVKGISMELYSSVIPAAMAPTSPSKNKVSKLRSVFLSKPWSLSPENSFLVKTPSLSNG